MPSFSQAIFTILHPYRVYIAVAVGIIICGIVAWWAYETYAKPVIITKQKQYDDVANRGDEESAEIQILFFHANWCPHCRKCQPDWERFSAAYHQKVIGNKTILCVDVDTTEETPETTALAKQYNVNGIPYVVAVVDGKNVELDGKVTEQNLAEFAKSVAGDPAAAK